MRLTIGDITEFEGDAIVNAANSNLAHGGGVAHAISAAAGPGLDDESRRLVERRGPIATGNAEPTAGYDLNVDWVIHAVGPVYGSHDGAEEEELLASAYRASLKVARELGVRTLAFPAISTGIFGYPLDEAARVAVSTVAHEAGDFDVTFVLFDERPFAAFEDALGE